MEQMLTEFTIYHQNDVNSYNKEPLLLAEHDFTDDKNSKSDEGSNDILKAVQNKG